MINEQFIEAVAELARMASEPIDHPAGGKAVLLPSGDIRHLQPLDPPLTHVKQHVTAFDADSFCAYVNRFEIGEPAGEHQVTTIFADPNKFQLRCVIDYHEDRKPGRCAHAIQFNVPFSEQWSRWRGIDGKPMGQAEFAEFIEENCQDCVEPPSAVFLDMVTNLQSKKKVAFESGVRLQDGSNQLVYAEEIETKGRGTMLVPSEFSIGVPIFLNGEAYKVRALLRYRIAEGTIAFTVKLHRRTFLEQTAFKDICEKVTQETALNVLNAWA